MQDEENGQPSLGIDAAKHIRVDCLLNVPTMIFEVLKARVSSRSRHIRKTSNIQGKEQPCADQHKRTLSMRWNLTFAAMLSFDCVKLTN